MKKFLLALDGYICLNYAEFDHAYTTLVGKTAKPVSLHPISKSNAYLSGLLESESSVTYERDGSKLALSFISTKSLMLVTSIKNLMGGTFHSYPNKLAPESMIYKCSFTSKQSLIQVFAYLAQFPYCSEVKYNDVQFGTKILELALGGYLKDQVVKNKLKELISQYRTARKLESTNVDFAFRYKT